MNTTRVVLVLVLSVISASTHAAERQRLTVDGGKADANVITEFLFPEAACEHVTYQCLSVRPSVERSVGVEVRFPTNSAELTPAARTHLDTLGKVLASRKKLDAGEIVIEGHADAR